MSKELITLFILIAGFRWKVPSTTGVQCFNLEERDPIVKRASIKGSYFGFSVAQHKILKENVRNPYWILVGAPLAQNLQPESNRSGALFKCPITNHPDDCLQVITDGARGPSGRYEFDDFNYEDDDGNATIQNTTLYPPSAEEVKSDQWLGVSVKSQNNGDGFALVCAHRYIMYAGRLNFSAYGLCYRLKNNLVVEDYIFPCKNIPESNIDFWNTMCQAGTGLAILDDGFTLIGGPGSYQWSGVVFGLFSSSDFLLSDKTFYIASLDYKTSNKFSYLGMSVSAGHFWSKTKQITVSGAPRHSSIGRVIFFDQIIPRKRQMVIVLELQGEQLGSSFGYELHVVDINNDGFDDLLVAAPFYYDDKTHYGGAVYVYHNLRNCKENPTMSCKWDQKLYGRPESRFGIAITSIGDINKDGYNDVAIGAPFEASTGMVYIYLSSKNGLTLEPTQLIRPRKDSKTFGHALSGGLDMDRNDYPDLVIGAYASDQVFLYKTRPIVDITIRIQDNELHKINATRKGCQKDPNNMNNACFSFQSCFTLKGLNNQSAPLTVHYQIKELPTRNVPRIWFHSSHNRNQQDAYTEKFIAVNNSIYTKEFCQSELVYIKDAIGDIISPIKFLVNYSLSTNDVGSPVLNKTSIREFGATFLKSCGNDDVCQSNLLLSAGTAFERTPDNSHYIVNLVGNDEFLIQCNVTNFGEAAYEAKLFVIHPEDLSFIALQQSNQSQIIANIICSVENSTMIACNLGNPLHGSKSVQLNLRFEIRTRTNENLLRIEVFVNSTSEELSKQTVVQFSAILQKIADYTIEGRAFATQLFYAGPVKGESSMQFLEDIGARVLHVYQVTNHGHWNLTNIEVEILWPYQVRPSPPNEEGKWLLYLEAVPQLNTNGFCFVNPNKAVNPLHLTHSMSSEALMLNDVDYNDVATDENVNENLRRRRDIDHIIIPEIIIGPDGKQRSVVTLDCLTKSARCARIRCKIFTLAKQDHFKIRILSRIWNTTLAEDYMSNIDWIRIRSFAQISFEDHKIRHSNNTISTTTIETVAYPGIVLADTSLSIWIIIVAITIGLLMLILLIILLYKIGFFKRHRYKDQTMTGSLKKKGESESLLRINEGRRT